MHTCMHTCIHAYMHTCIHAYMHTCIHAYMHTCIHSYIHTFIHTYICTFIHSLIIYIYIIMIIWVCSCGIMKFSGPTLPKLGLRESSVEPCRMHIIGSMAGFWVRRMLNPATEVQAQGISWAALRDKVTAQPVPTTQWPACNSGGCRCAPGHCWKKHFKACLQSGLNGLSILVSGFFMSCKILKIHIVVISPYKIIVYDIILQYATIDRAQKNVPSHGGSPTLHALHATQVARDAQDRFSHSPWFFNSFWAICYILW